MKLTFPVCFFGVGITAMIFLSAQSSVFAQAVPSSSKVAQRHSQRLADVVDKLSQVGGTRIVVDRTIAATQVFCDEPNGVTSASESIHVLSRQLPRTVHVVVLPLPNNTGKKPYTDESLLELAAVYDKMFVQPSRMSQPSVSYWGIQLTESQQQVVKSTLQTVETYVFVDTTKTATTDITTLSPSEQQEWATHQARLLIASPAASRAEMMGQLFQIPAMVMAATMRMLTPDERAHFGQEMMRAISTVGKPQ